MRPFIEAIPELTTGSLREFHAKIRSIPLAERHENDWKETTKVLEAELTARGDQFQPIDC